MATWAEQQKAAEAERHAKTIRTVGIVAAVVSVLSVPINGAVTTQNIEQSMKNTVTSSSVARESLCLSWASFVLQQQTSPEAAAKSADVVDAAIDRMGAIGYTRIEAEKDWQIADVPRQFATVPSHLPEPSGPLPLKNITAHCGSAHEMRMARETNDPQLFDYKGNG